MEFNPQPKIKPSNAPAVVVLVGLLALYNGAYFFSAKFSGQEASSFGRRLGIATDLSLCSPAFSTLVLAQTIFILVVFCLSMLGILAAIVDIFTYKRNFSEFGKLFAGTALWPLLVLLPWLTGDIFMLRRFDLAKACLQSATIQLYGPYFGIMIAFVAAWVALVLPFAIIKIVRSGKKPGDLPDDPVQREALLKVKANLDAMRSESMARNKSKAALAFIVFLLAIGLPVAGWLSISLLRGYHNLTWEQHTVRLVEVGARCTLQSRLKGGKWETQTVYDCVSNTNANPTALKRKANDAAGKEYRLLNKPTVKMASKRTDGTEEIIQGRRDVFMPVAVPMGTEITILRDPNDKTHIDRVFDTRDVMQLSVRLVLVLLLAMAAFFVVIRPLLRKPGKTGGGTLAVG